MNKAQTAIIGSCRQNNVKTLLEALRVRFDKNMNRHKGLEWAKVQAKAGS